jgi:tetratricopeptide (TPR) repeat protein
MNPSIFKEYSLKDIAKAAKNENKVYVVFVSDPNCNNCKTADSIMNNSKDIGETIDKHFLIKHLDASNFANLYKATNWGVQGVPSFVFFGPDGKIMEIVESKKTHHEIKEMFNVVIKKMIDQKISSPYNYQTIYDAKLAQNDTVGALEYLKSGRKLFPNDVYLMNRETETFLQKGQQDKALANLEAAILKEPNNAQLELVLGNVYDNIANPKGKTGKDTTKPADFDNLVMKAADHYKKAIDLKPSNQDSYFSALYKFLRLKIATIKGISQSFARLHLLIF